MLYLQGVHLDIHGACDCAGTPGGGAAAAPPLRQGVVQQCPQGTMLAGRANDNDRGRVGVPHAASPTAKHGHSALAPQCLWFAMRPQSPMAQSATRATEMRAISYESQAFSAPYQYAISTRCPVREDSAMASATTQAR